MGENKKSVNPNNIQFLIRFDYGENQDRGNISEVDTIMNLFDSPIQRVFMIYNQMETLIYIKLLIPSKKKFDYGIYLYANDKIIPQRVISFELDDNGDVKSRQDKLGTSFENGI